MSQFGFDQRRRVKAYSRRQRGKQTGTWRAQVYMKQDAQFLLLTSRTTSVRDIPLGAEPSQGFPCTPDCVLSCLRRESGPIGNAYAGISHAIELIYSGHASDFQHITGLCCDPKCLCLTHFCHREELSLSWKSAPSALPSLQPHILWLCFLSTHDTCHVYPDHMPCLSALYSRSIDSSKSHELTMVINLHFFLDVLKNQE